MIRLLLVLVLIKTAAADVIKNVSTSTAYMNMQLENDTTQVFDEFDISTTTGHTVFETWNVTDLVSPMFTVTESLKNLDNNDTNSSCAMICSKCTTQENTLHQITRRPDEKIPLYISAFYDGPDTGGWDGSGCVPAIEMAFDDINARSDILPQYELRPIWNDTKCNAGTGSRALFDQLFRDPAKIMILGSGCSPPTQAIASTAYYWNLITVAYGAESPGLSNRKFYPYFYRSISPATVYNYARIRLMREYGWNRVATIHENREVFKLGIDHMHDLLKEANITLVTSESFFTNPRNQIENIKRKDAKIIIGNMYESTARAVFCEAYKEGMTGKGYVWLMMGWYKHKFWETPGEDEVIDCTLEEMRQAVEGFIGTEGTLLNDPTTVTIANMTSTEYVGRLKSTLTQPEYLKYNYEPYGSMAYDGAWVIGLVLHEASLLLENRNTTKRLEDFTYNDSEMKDLFFRLLADVNFEGVSGPISFINGDRIGVIQLEQAQIGCLDGWVRHANDCYVFMDSPLTWTDAEGECGNFGAHLASLREPNDVNFIKWNWPAQSDSWFWIGLQQHQMEWTWSDTNMTEEAIWIPNGSSMARTSELHCVAMSKDGSWQVMDCSVFFPYICKTQTELVSHIVGYHDIRKDQLRWVSNLLWQDNEVPLDHTPQIIITYKRVQSGIPSYIFFIMCAMATSGGILALSFLTFNIKFRKQKFVRMSSPNLNNVIIAGSMLIYCWVGVSGIDNTLVSDWTFALACQIRTWLLSIGFVLAFGAMFSKTWRVYRVATFKKPKRRIITDQQLLLLVTILFIIDVIILILWQVISPWYIATDQGFERDDPNVVNQKLLPYVDYCTCSWITYWLIALCGFKGLLLIFGMFLAWETRKVQIRALNDSKIIGISIYNVVILCTIGGAISLIIDAPSTLYIFVASIVLFCTTLTLLTIFIPKIISVYKYPEGQPVSTMKNGSSRDLSESSQNLEDRLKKDPADCTPNLENINLRKRIIQLENSLRKAQGEANTGDITIAINNDNNASRNITTNN
ncbi:gamma-aminobutyric acid type B receptor subunit 1-like [Amphiura filiformis]|uniref:gamma-aminobutyric acid type B receptor subunit 1-like n=1 Tax=Amphiura filiformis TaxID=82378 RepID=UPI003B211734